MINILVMSLKRRKLVLFLSFLLLIAGIYSYVTIPKQEMPDMIVPVAVVQVIAPGLSAEEMEDVTEEVEMVLHNYEEIEKFSTITLDNVMIVLVSYDFSITDTLEVSERIENELNDLDLGGRVDSVNLRTNFDIPHVVYAFSGSNIPYLEEVAGEFQDTLDHENIKNVKMLSSLNTFVSVDIAKENIDNISLSDVYGLLYANSESIPLGSIGGNTLNIDGKYASLSDLEQMIITYVSSPYTEEPIPVYLGDLADISFQEYENKEYYYNGDRVVFLEVYFDENIDFSKLGKELRTNFNEFSSDVEITEMNYIPDYVDLQINQAMSSLLYCILIVVFVVLLGLGIRNSLAIALTIPVIVFGTILVVDLMGHELQRVSIAGIVISIGILVDNSIVISDAVQYYLDKGIDVYNASKRAVKDNSIAVLTSTLTTVAAFIPLTMLPGLAGQMAKSLPITVMTAIVLSYIFAMVVTPVIATFAFKPRKKRKYKDRLIIRKMMTKVLKVPRLVLFISFATFVVSGYLVVTNQPIEIFPADEKSEFYIDYVSDEISMTSSRALADDISEVLDRYDEIDGYYYSIGGGLPQFSSTTKQINEVVNEGRFYVHSSAESDEIKDLVQSVSKDLNKLSGEVTTNQMSLGIASAPVELSIVSKDLAYLNRVTDNLRDKLDHTDNVQKYTITETSTAETYRLDINRELLSANGIQLVELQNFIYVTLNGLKLNSFLYQDTTIDIFVQSDISTLDELLDLSYKDVPLDDLIEVYIDDSFDAIYKLNGEYQVLLEASPVDENSLELENDIKDFLEGYPVEVVSGGDTELATTIFSDVGKAAGIAVVLIYLIMFIQFNSFRQPLIVFFTIPLSLIGSFVMMLIFDTPISLTSLLGMVSLIGVVVNTGILLVEYINKATADGKSKTDACIEAVRRRLRPILLASTTTALGLIPLMVNGGEFFSPLAVVFMGGIISTTVLTIFVVPSLYMLLND